MASKVTIRGLVNELLMMYSNGRGTAEEFAKLWEKFFSHVPDDVLTNAVDTYMDEAEFFPTISQIFDQFEVEQYSAELAWELNVRYCHEMATYHGITAGLAMAHSNDPEPKPPSDMIGEMCKLIKWSDVAYSDERNLPFLRKEWMKLYDEQVTTVRKARRAGIRQGDPKYIKELTQPKEELPLSPEERRKAILVQGLKNVQKSPENGTQSVSEHSGLNPEMVEIKELTREEEDAILNGDHIVDAGEIF